MQNLLEISVNHDVHDQCEVRDSNVMGHDLIFCNLIPT